MEDKLILLERKNPTTYEVHRWEISQAKNLILSTPDKDFAKNLVDGYNSVVNRLPKEVEDAKRFIQKCESDIGFMGSPEYYEKRVIVKNYYAKINEEKQEAADRVAYEKLKAKYETPTP